LFSRFTGDDQHGGGARHHSRSYAPDEQCG
jgi:hypothetical protein